MTLSPPSKAAIAILASAASATAYNAFPYAQPVFRYESFSKLDITSQNIAEEKLGYTPVTWNNHGLADIERKGWDNLTSNQRDATSTLGFTQATWDCFINHYEQYSWDELAEEGVQEHYRNLGWDEGYWTHEKEGTPYTDARWWGQLTDTEKLAANKLCYFENNWDKIDMNPNDSFFPYPMPDFRYVPWAELPYVTRLTASGMMNYTETNMKQTGGVGEETLIMDGQPQQQLMTVKNEKLAHSELESYCNKKFELEQGPRPIPDASVWMLLKKLYVDHFVKVGIGSFESSAIMRPSLLVPYKVGQVEKGGGRGLFATRDIPKFAHIYNGTGTHATFSEANLMKYMRLVHEYTQALDLSLQTNNATVNNKKDLVCDLLHWNYHEYDEKKEVYYYILCLDDSSLMNHNEKHPNVGNCLENLFGNKGSFATKDFCHENLFALRDITAGEEIVENYGRFDLEYVNGKLKE